MSQEPTKRAGVIAWMVRNRVTPNLLMIALLAGGVLMATQLKQEVFPEFELDLVDVSVPYPGASPEEVERGIVLAIEEAVRGLDGIKEVTSTAGEGGANVRLELEEGSNAARITQDVKQAVDAIRTFPLDAEDPRVTQLMRRREVLDLQIYGDISERQLREVVEQVRDGLLADPGITQLEIEAARAVELHVEIPEATLRKYGLTLQGVAQTIARASVELPGGRVETTGGEILLRVKDRRDWAAQFATIPVVTTADGAVLRLGDVATVSEGFEEVGRRAFYKGLRSTTLEIYRVGDQTPIEVSDAVRRVMGELEIHLPKGVGWEINRDRSDIFRDRLELLLRNAAIGLLLVLVLLGLFLSPRLAFWVTMGIPTSFLGAFVVLAALGVSLNMVSMFAFIIALGIVVDDAIVVGENIYELRSHRPSYESAAIDGATGVIQPVSFAILTNMVTFGPLLFVPGYVGKIWSVIPIVVIVVFALSWLESLIILPAHLVHGSPDGWSNGLFRGLRWVAQSGLDLLIRRIYLPFLRMCLRWRLATLGVAAATLMVVVAYVAGGHIGRTMMPRVESDVAVASAVLPPGTPETRVREVMERLVQGMERVAEGNGGKQLLIGTYARYDGTSVELRAYLTAPAVRPISTRDVTKAWREAVGIIEGLQSLQYQSDRGGPGSGAALTVELSHRSVATLQQASQALADALQDFPNVSDIDDGYASGKEQMNLRLKPAGEALGLSSTDLARQVRSAFHGAVAVRQQRERHEVTTLVRRPRSERSSVQDVEALMVTTPTGARVPLRQVAEVERSRAYTSIQRRSGRRTVEVTANVEPIGQTPQIMATLDDKVLPQLRRDFPGLTAGYEGRQARFAESIEALVDGFKIAMAIIFFLLAIPFRSYVQPAIVMLAIPFGLAGAVAGHVVMGYDISLLSLMGAVALSGVVVNDSLLLVDYANSQMRIGATAREAALEAARRRFRPVILTTMTTFGGLAPMVFETSRQARFMIPMAISLGFGIVFATVVTLVIVPTLYVVLDDVKHWLMRMFQMLFVPAKRRAG